MCEPGCKIEEVMTTEVISVQPEVQEEDVAALLSKYKFSSMPVVDQEGFLLGVIPADDLMPVIANRLKHLYNKAVGTDAEVMEKLSPVGAAKVRVPWKKEGMTSLLMSIVCGIVLGGIGAIWAKQLPFGIVIGAAIVCSMLTAGLMGTIIPILSKRFGFDPATTAGPFETAFQDVIGFAVFLGLATLFQSWMV